MPNGTLAKNQGGRERSKWTPGDVSALKNCLNVLPGHIISREQIKEIALKLGRTEDAVVYRIYKLQRHGVIGRFSIPGGASGSHLRQGELAIFDKKNAPSEVVNAISDGVSRFLQQNESAIKDIISSTSNEAEIADLRAECALYKDKYEKKKMSCDHLEKQLRGICSYICGLSETLEKEAGLLSALHDELHGVVQ